MDGGKLDEYNQQLLQYLLMAALTNIIEKQHACMHDVTLYREL